MMIRMSLVKTRNYLSDGQLLQYIKDFHVEFNRNPNIKDFNDCPFYPNYGVYRNRFGNWNNALKLAGLEVKEHRKFSKEDVEHIVKLYQKDVPLKEIASLFNVSDLRIIQEIKKKSVPLRNNQWTDEKIKLLKEIYPTGTWEDLLEKLSPFNKDSIVKKASSLNIARDNYYWTKEEVQLLKDNYSNAPMYELLGILSNKTESAIRTKANKMGLVQRTFWSQEEIGLLKELYPTLPNHELLEYFPHRTLSSISSMATMILGINKSEESRLRTKEKTKKEILIKLKQFAVQLGRTPFSYEVTENKSMPGIVSYHRAFGSYTNACKEAGLAVNANIFGESVHCVSKNGDVCLSKKEKEITDILFDNNLDYEKEVLYKDIIEDYTEKNIRCDWFINGIIVEYFGMPDKEYYRERMDEKINICEENNVVLIQLFEQDVKNNFTGLINKFAKHGIEIKSTTTC